MDYREKRKKEIGPEGERGVRKTFFTIKEKKERGTKIRGKKRERMRERAQMEIEKCAMWR